MLGTSKHTQFVAALFWYDVHMQDGQENPEGIKAYISAPILTYNSWNEANVGEDAEIVVARMRQQGYRPDHIFDFIARQYSFAVPNSQIIEKLRSLGRLIDMGAGNGYWSYRLRSAGADIMAVEPRGTVANPVFPTIKGDHRTIVKYPDRALLIVWPTRNNLWAKEAVELYGGNTVAYIGDPNYKETATLDFPKALADGGFIKSEEMHVGSWPLFFEDKLIIWKRQQ